MTKFYMVERQACEIAWRYPVEANNENEAFEKYGNGDHGEAVGGPEIGDSIDSYQYDLDIEQAPATADSSPPPANSGDHDALLAIQELLDGVEWDSDTLGHIAMIMVDAGYRIRSSDE